MREFTTICKDSIEYHISEARNVSLQQETVDEMIQHIHLVTKKLMELAEETIQYIPIEIHNNLGGGHFRNVPTMPEFERNAELGKILIDENKLQDLDKEFNYKVLRLGTFHELLHGIQDKYYRIQKRGFDRNCKIVNTPNGNLAEILSNLGEMLYDTETYLEEITEANYDFTALNELHPMSILVQGVAREIGIKTALQILLWEHPDETTYLCLRAMFRKPYCHITGRFWPKLLEAYTKIPQNKKNNILQKYIKKSGTELYIASKDYEEHINYNSHRNI